MVVHSAPSLLHASFLVSPASVPGLPVKLPRFAEGGLRDPPELSLLGQFPTAQERQAMVDEKHRFHAARSQEG